LIRSSKEISWASDSLLNIEQKDSVVERPAIISQTDSNENKNEFEIIEQNDPPQKINREEVEKKKVEEEKTIEREGVEFEEPKNITLEQAYSLFNDRVAFIDARDEAEYIMGFISGSINIPYYDFESHKQKLDKPLVTYCAGTDCDLSILLANQLIKLGYKKVYIFFGGWLEWQNANYPIEHPSEE
jgi:rhodanese-related sulfurtransferase